MLRCPPQSPAIITTLLFLLFLCPLWAGAQAPGPGRSNHPDTAVVISIQGKVEYLKADTSQWTPAHTNQMLLPLDRLRTGERSRAAIRLTDLSVLRLTESTTIQIEARPQDKKAELRVNVGSTYLQSRQKPGEIILRTPVVSGAIRGTEFNLAVAEDGRTLLTLLDGDVDLQNSGGAISLHSGEQATIDPNQPPRKTAVINSLNIIQWCLYYPAVLDLSELPLTPDEQSKLAAPFDAYRRGDLPGALASYPSATTPGSNAEKILLASLLLSVGNVPEAEQLLGGVGDKNKMSGAESKLADAIGQLIAAVKFQTRNPASSPTLATEFLAQSYYLQSRSQLPQALAAALSAASRSPRFGFAWARVAELQFSFGRIPEAKAALDQALSLAPRNAQALALKGFLLSADSRWTEALLAFDQAIDADGALGNAWLGRGLAQIHQGRIDAGQKDLQMAAALEPNRALLRSYSGKAFQSSGKNALAEKEFKLARQLDPNDPTAWLYSALLDQQENRINAAILDLEKSRELNNNRSVYRSQLLLDQDRAVRSANLASIYRDAGMTDVSVREATRAVQSDYANYSAHLFLANSYDTLRDPKLINLRYETATVSEYLIANLLAPVAAGPLSRNISQQEYSRFFEGDRLGVVSETEYRSNGEWRQAGSIYGSSGNVGFSIDTDYRTDNGFRPNNDLDLLNLSAQLKWQVSPRDIAYLQAIYSHVEAGDLTQYYDQRSAATSLRTTEKQEPILLAGWQHEWSPSSHTLFLASRLVDTLSVTNSAQPVLLLGRNASGNVNLISRPAPPTAAQDYRGDLEIYSAELQQLWQPHAHTVIAGARFQSGEFMTRSGLSASSATRVGNESVTLPFFFSTAPVRQDFKNDFQRLSVYAYDNWQILDPLLLTAGLSYDRLLFPENFRNAPIVATEQIHDQLSPKAGFLWTPADATTFRGSYTRSLGGVSFDQSVRLEPSQVAGFNQSYRSLIPESVAGAAANAYFESFGLGLDHRLPSHTYLGVQGEILNSEVRRTIGSFNLRTTFPFPVTPSGTRQEIDFEEKSLLVTVNQLIGEEWSLGASYRLTHADMQVRFPEIPATVSKGATSHPAAALQQLTLFAAFNHRCGFFTRAESLWNVQSDRGYAPDLPGDDFWQLNFFAGYRFPRRHAELSLGLLNATDRDYHLNPLTLYNELPRQRTLMASLKFNF